MPGHATATAARRPGAVLLKGCLGLSHDVTALFAFAPRGPAGQAPREMWELGRARCRGLPSSGALLTCASDTCTQDASFPVQFSAAHRTLSLSLSLFLAFKRVWVFPALEASPTTKTPLSRMARLFRKEPSGAERMRKDLLRVTRGLGDNLFTHWTLFTSCSLLVRFSLYSSLSSPLHSLRSSPLFTLH